MNQPDDTFLLTPPDPVTEVRYFSPIGRRAAITSTFRATVDLSPASSRAAARRPCPVVVESIDGRITVIGVDARRT